jgi:hypothetical protein
MNTQNGLRLIVEPGQSSNIRVMLWDDNDRAFYANFNDTPSRVYRYPSTHEIKQKMIDAESKGRAFNQLLRTREHNPADILENSQYILETV